MIKSILSLTSIILSSLAFAFPSNIRHGYNSCAACHVSETGGGVLTPYGRMSSAEIMSTWGSETDAEPFFGLLRTSDSLDVGADYQAIYLKDRHFTMQKEAQAALNLSRKVYLVGSYGYYPDEPEVRKLFLQGAIDGNWTIKLGKFFPAYGIMSNEHLYAYRSRYFNQGSETFTGEATFRTKDYEAIVSKILGSEKDYDDGYLIGREGLSGRVSFTPTRSLNFGFSAIGLIDPKGDIETDAAIHILWGPWSWLWTEQQYSREDQFARIGIEPFKGFTIRPTYSSNRGKEIGVQWLPYPHLDFQFIYSKDGSLGLLHYYL